VARSAKRLGELGTFRGVKHPPARGPTSSHKWRAGREWLRAHVNAPSAAALNRRGKTVGRRLVGWYEESGRDFPWRRAGASVYQRVVSEVLLQQTTATAVAGQYDDFFSRFPSWRSLAEADTSQLEQQLRPLGLWQRRARALRSLGRAVVENKEQLPRDRAALEQYPAIGQYVASAVRVFAHGLSEPLLDVNMARVLERYFGTRTRADIRYDPFLQAAARACIRGKDPTVVNWAFLDLGSLVCKARSPSCPACPLQRGCHYAVIHRP